MPAATRFRFRPFALDPAIRQLARDATPVTLPPKAFDVLVLLVSNRNRVVGKQELLDAVWPDTAVIENTLIAGLGDRDRAFAWLDKAYDARAWDLVHLNVDMRFDGVRADPRFDALLHRVGLPAGSAVR
jgi:hypothetical protein